LDSRRSQWPRGLNHGSMATWLLGLRVRIPPRSCTLVSCEWCVLLGRGLCVGLITFTEESHRVVCVWVWSWIPNKEEALFHWGLLLVQRSPTEWGVSECDRESPTMRGLVPLGAVARPEESYGVGCVWVWSWIPDNEGPCSTGSCCSSRGVLPSGVCLSVIVNPRQWRDPSSVETVTLWRKNLFHPSW